MHHSHTFPAKYHGFEVELTLEADGSHPGGVRIAWHAFGQITTVVVPHADAIKIGDNIKTAADDHAEIEQAAGEGGG